MGEDDAVAQTMGDGVIIAFLHYLGDAMSPPSAGGAAPCSVAPICRGGVAVHPFAGDGGGAGWREAAGMGRGISSRGWGGVGWEEYQALILGLEMVVDIKQLHLKVYGDFQLVVNQLIGLYEVEELELLPYHNYTKKQMGWLGDVELDHLRKDNKQVDALAKLASTH
ncbi:UNVERIFIED_CONTAM: hypothetical protein Scaly_2518600 [Sesamum calycinum]|uniref:RNase H type-1 domain-containing protein n=1 Tax=Sesamum calycinum TaxID=2727403 RepID=A0AAW2LTR2_9LAMI